VSIKPGIGQFDHLSDNNNSDSDIFNLENGAGYPVEKIIQTARKENKPLILVELSK
jgi:UDP-glucose 4-epimerase